jgi:hypothetical protein
MSERFDSLCGKVDVAAISTDGSMLAMGDREESAVWILDMNTRQVSTRLDMPRSGTALLLSPVFGGEVG